MIATLQMNADLGVSAAVFGSGSGMMFVAYMLAEPSSNLDPIEVSARGWTARIMVTWGLSAFAMALMSAERRCYVVRALLGAAEVGFFPGIIHYLSTWFPPCIGIAPDEQAGRIFGDRTSE